MKSSEKRRVIIIIKLNIVVVSRISNGYAGTLEIQKKISIQESCLFEVIIRKSSLAYTLFVIKCEENN